MSFFFLFFFFFSSRRRHTRSLCDWSSDVCSSDLHRIGADEDVLFHDHQSAQDGRGVHEGAGMDARQVAARVLADHPLRLFLAPPWRALKRGLLLQMT